MQTVCFKKEDIIRIIRNINILVVSLDRIGSEASEVTREEYHRLTSEFIDNWRVSEMLTDARAVLSKAFSREVEDDGMDELERIVENYEPWRVSKQLPVKPFVSPILEQNRKKHGDESRT